MREGALDAAAAAKLLDWLRRCDAMPDRAAIAARFGFSTSQAGRLIRWLEEDGSIEVDRSNRFRPVIIVKEAA